MFSLSRNTSRRHMHTSALTKLVDDLVNWPPPVLPQVLFA